MYDTSAIIHCKDNLFRDTTQMIHQEITIPRYDWHVYAYYAVDCYYIDEIVSRLRELGCDDNFLRIAERNMACGNLDHGLTYSNIKASESVMVVGLASSAEQFLNSLAHELFHLVNHICEARGIDIGSEEAAYLMGDTAQQCYSYTRQLISNNTI